jgi:hypothetical protein
VSSNITGWETPELNGGSDETMNHPKMWDFSANHV